MHDARHSPFPSESRQRNSVLAALEHIWGLHADLNLTDLLVLLAVAESPGISLTELAGQLGLTTITASRSLRVFLDHGERGALPPALGLLELTRRPDDARVAEARLTPRGLETIRALNAFIAEGVSID